MDLLSFENGACFVPRDGPYPAGLLLMWTHSGEKREMSSLTNKMRVFVWNSVSLLPSLEQLVGDEGVASFKTIVLRLAGISSKVCGCVHV